MTDKIKVIIYGCGVMGRKVAQALLDRKSFDVVGAADINPGYLMDTLPLILTAPCPKVKSIKVTRMTNSAKRRFPFQVKAGTGLT